LCENSTFSFHSEGDFFFLLFLQRLCSRTRQIPQLKGTSFFAVFDGHGGDSIARECAAQLLPSILAHVSSAEVYICWELRAYGAGCFRVVVCRLWALRCFVTHAASRLQALSRETPRCHEEGLY
jgi:hypothetical protein